MSGYSLSQTRLPDGGNKRSLLRAVERSRASLPLRSVLRVVRLSPSRYHVWNREEQCGLDDKSSCPRSSPQQLTATEVGVIHELVTSDDYRHVPTGTLVRLAQRIPIRIHIDAVPTGVELVAGMTCTVLVEPKSDEVGIMPRVFGWLTGAF